MSCTPARQVQQSWATEQTFAVITYQWHTIVVCAAVYFIRDSALRSAWLDRVEGSQGLRLTRQLGLGLGLTVRLGVVKDLLK